MLGHGPRGATEERGQHGRQKSSASADQPSETLPTFRPDNYLKNMTALKGQEGIYGLGIGVLWSWKESQRFYGQWAFFFFFFQQTNFSFFC